MTEKHKQKPLALWPKEWARLDQLAQDLGCLAPTGMTAGKPSWRSLIKELARGQLVISRAPPAKPPGA